MTHIFKIFVSQFIPFLVARQAFDQYVLNFSASFFFRISLDEFIGTTEIDRWIKCAFKFEDTPEGFDFWMRINKEWQDIATHF